MTLESGDTVHLRATTPPPYKTPRRRRRCCLPCTLCLLLLLLAIFIVVLVLALTVFKPKDPTTHLVSARVTGFSPRLTLLTNFQLNATFDLDILVHNPNPARFKHEVGFTQLTYRGVQVGVADVEPGTIPSKGSTHVMLALTVEADKFAAELENLVADVSKGEVGFDAQTRIPGRVTILGMFKHHALALSECHVVVGFPDLKVKQQDCTQDTKL